MDKKHQRQVTLITVAIVLLLGIVLFSYGFVTFNADNSNPQEVGVDTATVALTYTDCTDRNQEDCANITADLEPGDSISKTFQVENTGTVETIYSMKFNSLINTFVDGELVYTVENIDTKEILINESEVPYSETEITNKIFLPAMNIGVGETQRYKMTIKFLNTDYNQSLNDNATFTIKLGITQKAPILAASDTWFTQGGTSVKRSSITKINIVDSYEPAGTVTDTWDASKDKDGSVTAYVEGTVLTLSGNGFGVIYANPDSSFVFFNFENLTSISGLNLFDTENAISMKGSFAYNPLLKSLDLSSLNVSNVTDMYGMFMGKSASPMTITSIGDISNWNTSKVTTMIAMFQNCINIESLNTTNWDTSSCQDMKNMFKGCSSLTTIGDTYNWETKNVTTMYAMFDGCKSLKVLDTSNWNTSKITDMSYMFKGCSSLKTLDTTNWNTKNVTTMYSMFNGCDSLTSIGDTSNLNTENVTDMSRMFYNCTSLTELNTSSWNTSKVTDMSFMFAAYNEEGTARMSLTTIGDTTNWNTSNVTTMTAMFQKCSSLKEVNVSNWNTDKVTDMSYMFSISSIKALDLSNFKTSQVTNMTNMFAGMTGLEKVTLGVNFNFKGNGNTSSVLPTPASGYWYNSSGQALTPANVPSLKADTYYATQQA